MREEAIYIEPIWLEPDEEETCDHEMEPAFTAAYNAFELIIFPGMRCRKCRKGFRCIPDEEQAQRDFRETFRMSFDEYFENRRVQLRETMLKDTRTWIMAKHTDYRLLA